MCILTTGLFAGLEINHKCIKISLFFLGVLQAKEAVPTLAWLSSTKENYKNITPI